MSQFQNVSSIVHAPDNWQGSLEEVYLRDFFSILRQRNPELFASFDFEVLHLNTIHRSLPALTGGPRKVLLWLSDEGSSVPLEASTRYAAIFKSYWLTGKSIGNIHPFALCGSGEVHALSPKPMKERQTPVFFSGNFCPNRVDFLRAFTSFRWLPPFPLLSYPLRRGYYELLRRVVKRRDFSGCIPGSSVSFTGGFRKGLPPGEFASALADAKIALCPEGFRSKETIRMFEAMKLGCVVVGPRMPPNPFYHGSPVIQCGSWLDIQKRLADLLSDHRKLEDIHRATLGWWEAHCSAEAMAKKAEKVLGERMKC